MGDASGSSGSSSATAVDGIGVLDYHKAIDLARNTEGDLDPGVATYLEQALDDIWSKINAAPDSYILERDEFAIFNFYIQRYDGQPVAEQAIDRYWRNTTEPSSRPQ